MKNPPYDVFIDEQNINPDNLDKKILCIIPARSGSKGLPNTCR